MVHPFTTGWGCVAPNCPLCVCATFVHRTLKFACRRYQCCYLWPAIKRSMASLQAETVLSKIGLGRMSSEKQETLLKMLILATAAILCEHVAHSLTAFSSCYMLCGEWRCVCTCVALSCLWRDMDKALHTDLQ